MRPWWRDASDVAAVLVFAGIAFMMAGFGVALVVLAVRGNG